MKLFQQHDTVKLQNMIADVRSTVDESLQYYARQLLQLQHNIDIECLESISSNYLYEYIITKLYGIINLNPLIDQPMKSEVTL